MQTLIDKLQQLDTSLPLNIRVEVYNLEQYVFQKLPAMAPYQWDARRSKLSDEDVRIVYSNAGAVLGCEIAVQLFVEAEGESEKLDVGLIKPT